MRRKRSSFLPPLFPPGGPGFDGTGFAPDGFGPGEVPGIEHGPPPGGNLGFGPSGPTLGGGPGFGPPGPSVDGGPGYGPPGSSEFGEYLGVQSPPWYPPSEGPFEHGPTVRGPEIGVFPEERVHPPYRNL